MQGEDDVERRLPLMNGFTFGSNKIVDVCVMQLIEPMLETCLPTRHDNPPSFYAERMICRTLCVGPTMPR